jgi:hypothetical protein
MTAGCKPAIILLIPRRSGAMGIKKDARLKGQSSLA